MQKGQYYGLRRGTVKGMHAGLSQGLAKGLYNNEKARRFSNFDIIWTMGDSINRGNSDAVGATPEWGTVWQFDNSARNLRMIRNTDLLEPVAAGAVGSQWPQFGITYHNRTRRNPVFVNCGVGGSAFFNATPGFSWYTNDTLFTNAVQKLKNCLAFMGKTAPKYVIIGSGYNDSVQGQSVTLAHITSLVDRILAIFPGQQIFFTLPFSNSATIATYANLTILFQIRKWIKGLMFTYPTVGICGDLSVLHSWTGCFQADLVHLNFAGNAFLGDKSAQGLTIPDKHHKYTRGIASTFYWRVSGARLTMIDKLVYDLESAGILQNIDSLIIPSNGGDNTDSVGWKNAITDWAFISNHSPADALNYQDYTYQGYFPGGASDGERISNTPITLAVDKASLSTDFLVGVFFDSSTTAAGTVAAPFGVRESAAGGIVLLRQNAATLGVFAGSTTETTDGAENTFASNSFYALARDAGNQSLIKNSTVVATTAVAATALNPGANIRGLSTGNYNNNGTIQFRWAGGVKAQVIMKYSSVSGQLSTFNTIMNNFLALWLQNFP